MKNKKELGQNWLKNREVLEEIATLSAGSRVGIACPLDTLRAAQAKSSRSTEHSMPTREPAPGRSGQSSRSAEHPIPVRMPALCVEIGPGLGTLTSSLLKRFEKVIAIELDERLAENLPKSFPGKNLEVVNEDVLKFDFSTIHEDYVIAGNIPYYITSPILEKVLSLKNRPRRVVILMQKEVAERILSEKETLLSLMVKNRAEVYPGPVVGREEFVPAPKVDSQVLVFEPKEPEVADEVFRMIRAGFSAPRKKLIHNLASANLLEGDTQKEAWENAFRELKLDINARPGDLKLADYKKLYEFMF